MIAPGEVTFSRRYTPFWVMSNGQRIGQIIRFTHPSRTRRFGLFLHGVYWHNGEPNTSGGQAGTSFRTVAEARAKAVEVGPRAKPAPPRPTVPKFHVELAPPDPKPRSHPDGIAELIGVRYGRLIVLERAPSDPKLRGARYNCRCDCGTVVVRLAYNLRQGNAKSCGCAKLNPRPRTRRTA